MTSTYTRDRLTSELRKIYDNKDFVIVVLSNASHEDDRNFILEYIHKGKNVSKENLFLLSLHLDIERKIRAGEDTGVVVLNTEKLEQLTAESNEIIIDNGKHSYIIKTDLGDGLHIFEQHRNDILPEKEEIFSSFNDLITLYLIDGIPLRDILLDFCLVTYS